MSEPQNSAHLSLSIFFAHMILSGELDALPEQSFYLVGDIDEAIAKADELQSKS